MNESPTSLALFLGEDGALAEQLRPIAAAAGFSLAVHSVSESPLRMPGLRPAVVLIDCDKDLDTVGRLLDEDHLDDALEVLLIGRSRQQFALQQWLTEGRAFFLGKPLNLDYVSQLLLDIKGELERSGGAAQENVAADSPLDQFGLLRGSSKAMRRIYRLLRKVAPTDTSVLICGESGTGKELVAETMHAVSACSAGPFLAINCGAIPSELVESELFGHEKGSFSGAFKQHRGLFERADGGTLFLDEITEMPAEVQVKLLRVLETGRFRRVGAESDLASSVRIVAATNRTPEQAIASGKLRQDLYFRVASFVIRLPPLRARGEDVVGLARIFLTELNRRHGTGCRFTPEAEQAILLEQWPGNVRELKNAVERAYLVADELIQKDDLPDPEIGNIDVDDGEYLRVSVGSSLDEAERKLIFATLEAVAGNKPEAADALGISLKTLYNRLNQYAEDDEPRAGAQSQRL